MSARVTRSLPHRHHSHRKRARTLALTLVVAALILGIVVGVAIAKGQVASPATRCAGRSATPIAATR